MGIEGFPLPAHRNHEVGSGRSLYHLAYGLAAAIIFMVISLLQEPRLMNEPGLRSVCNGLPRVHLSSEGSPIRALDGTQLLIDPDRTLWMAGWHARFSRYYAQPPPIITWTQGAEEYVEAEYRRLHFPVSCSKVKGKFSLRSPFCYMTTNAYPWGVMSALRDYQSDIFRAMAQNYTLVHQGEYGICTDDPTRFLNCFWEDLNGCQAAWSNHPDVPRVELSQGTTTAVMSIDEFPHWLWDEMHRRGLLRLQDGQTGKEVVEADVPDADQYFQLKLSVLRAILTKRIFKPRAHIRAKADALVGQWRTNLTHGESWSSPQTQQGKGLIVHMRRTDKKVDLGPHWHHIDFQSTAHLGQMVQTMEATLNSTFGHVFAMSDDPQLEQRAVDELTPFFGSAPAKLMSHQLCALVGANHAEYNGHETLNATQRHELYNIVISQLYAAAEVADYLIGSGSCGVSQFMAQLLGGKHMIEPSLLTMWEEDIVVKKCRWLLRQREASSDRCATSTTSPIPDYANRVYQKALFDHEWDAHECSKFSYALPDCLTLT